MKVESYLFLGGRCDEAIEFYRRALDAEVTMVLRFNESPDPMPPGMLAPGWENKVMHASLRIGDTVVMASDGMGKEQPGFQGFALSLSVRDAAEAERRFNALAEGGQVRMKLGKTFWSPCFGMVADRFGVGWMVVVEG